jgi:hypothetical protein
LARDHLRFQEIEWLAEGPRRGYATPGQEAQLDEIRHHLVSVSLARGLYKCMKTSSEDWDNWTQPPQRLARRRTAPWRPFGGE